MPTLSARQLEDSTHGEPFKTLRGEHRDTVDRDQRTSSIEVKLIFSGLNHSK
jgi:hypothetical protein